MDRLGGPQPALETFERCKLNLPNVEIYRNQLLLKTSYLTKKHAIEACPVEPMLKASKYL